MSKTYKVLSVLLAVAMLFSVVAVSAFAAYTPTDTDKNGNAYTQNWALSEPINNGDGTWSVNVSLTTNYPVGSIQFKIANTNNTGVKLTGAVKGAGFTNDATVTYSNATGKVTIVPKTTGKTNLACSVINGVVATLTYTVESGASANINIVNEPKGTEGADVGGSLVATRCGTAELVGDYIADGPGVVGQKVLGVGETRLIGAAEKPELVVKANKGGVIDTTRTSMIDSTGKAYTVDGYIYGVEPENYETVTDVFEVKNGTMEIVNNAYGSDCGTGTLVNVKDKSGVVVATYVLIIFGDLDGDGQITGEDALIMIYSDAYMLDQYSTYNLEAAPHLWFAGDLDGDYYISGEDALSAIYHDAWMYGTTYRMYQSDIIAKLS